MVHGGDASRTASLIKHLLSDGKNYIRQIKTEQEQIRHQYYNRQEQILPYPEARSLSPVLTATKQQQGNFSPESYRLPVAFGRHNILERRINLRELTDKIDWTPFFHFWGFKGKFPEIIHRNEEANHTYQAALKTLDNVID